MTYSVCLIDGDGIGHEVIPAGRRVLEATGVPFSFDDAVAGWDAFQQYGTALPDATVETVERCDVTLFGAVSSPLKPVEGYRSPIVALRRRLGLYANLRPVLSPALPGFRRGVDMLIVRENTEGLYAGRERREGDRAVTERVITREASERIARLACSLAARRRGHLTVVHKANVLRATCGLFRETALAVAAEFPDVQVEEMLVDATAMRLLMNPERFDVIVTTNLFGDILSDEASGLVGGLGLAPSANIGDRHAIFEPVHGSAPDIAGKGIANPCATFLACALLLDHLGQTAAAQNVRQAVTTALGEGVRTPDLSGNATTDDVTNAVVTTLRRDLS